MDVVAACPDVEWLQDLMKGLIDGSNGDSYSQDAVESCEQLAKCISEKILKPDRDMDKKRLVACFTTLLLIGRISRLNTKSNYLQYSALKSRLKSNQS